MCRNLQPILFSLKITLKRLDGAKDQIVPRVGAASETLDRVPVTMLGKNCSKIEEC